MRLIVLALAALAVTAGCSASPEVEPTREAPQSTAMTTTTTTAPTSAAPVEIVSFAGKGCELIGPDLLAELDINVSGASKGVAVCMWDDPETKRRLMVRLIGDHDPLLEVRGAPNPVDSAVGGFPAKHVPEGRDNLCDIYVRTAPEQGFAAAYGIMDGTVDDLCAGAVRAAEQVAEKIKG
ncbi:DUF3558 family protein [Actinokineospora fastidiosa]|uniref:DUF3558 domain-containing protein n=1 Tax=Actinokineospora fastidiosa TaxID=1816 RepID=A0A918LAW4_9PSEU|nr:DUF3558 family protein [Actinokineospora fastidiosa]GGS24841.1 hypothetical protein GCM10010171_17550 [Actinokineospora fastidiosa]